MKWNRIRHYVNDDVSRKYYFYNDTTGKYIEKNMPDNAYVSSEEVSVVTGGEYWEYHGQECPQIMMDGGCRVVIKSEGFKIYNHFIP
jgi:hypothetical protein